jgi:hypothetical protein
MSQSVPVVSDADVERIVRRDFAAEEVSEVLSTLAEYGKKSWHGEVVRVRLAILKMANGSLDRLQIWMAAADRDYRDALAAAEYPRYMKSIGPNEKDAVKREQVIAKDSKEYREWIERK